MALGQEEPIVADHVKFFEPSPGYTVGALHNSPRANWMARRYLIEKLVYTRSVAYERTMSAEAGPFPHMNS